MRPNTLLCVAIATTLYVSITACQQVQPASSAAIQAALVQDAAFETDASQADAESDVSEDLVRESEIETTPLTADQQRARVLLDDALDAVERSVGRALPDAWAATSADEMHRVAQLVREASPSSSRDRWLRTLSSEIESAKARHRNGPTDAQHEALRQLAEHSVADFDLQWDFSMGTPARLEDVGYVLRDSDATHVWESFLRDERRALHELFDESLFSELQTTVVDHVGAFDIVRMRRQIDSISIAGQFVDAYITNGSSVLGAGVLMRVRSHWDHRTTAAFGRLQARGVLSEAEALEVAGGRSMGTILSVACADECTAQWSVVRAPEDEVVIDATSGEVVAQRDPMMPFSGTVRQQGFIAGNGGVMTTMRMRGARITTTGFADLGYTSRSDGTYNVGAPPQWYVDFQGGRSTGGGIWPRGRVDRRDINNIDTIVPMPWIWHPGSNPNPTVSWSSNATSLRHSTQLVYGWYSYWQELFRVGVGVEVPDTFSIQVTAADNVHGSTGAVNNPPPGSGQTNWAYTKVYWPSSLNDGDPPDVDAYLSLFAHEYAHGIQQCASEAGPSCWMNYPENYAHPPDATDWRRSVWGAFQENYPSFFAAALAEFRSTHNGGSGAFEPTWNYGGYFDTYDDFANWAEDRSHPLPEDSIGLINCRVPETMYNDCPGAYECMPRSPHSPHAVPSSTRGTCVRSCDSVADCLTDNAGTDCVSACMCEDEADCFDPSEPCGQASVCGARDYEQQWFVNVGTRLLFDVGWSNSFLLMTLAASGVSANGLRDFNTGTDSWYASLADLGLNVAAVTRAVRSVTNEAGLTSRDDFADSLAEALPIPVWNTTGTSIWWGSGPGSYPQLDSVSDSDWFLFRGVYGSNYTITATPRPGSTVDLSLSLYRVSTGALVATTSLPSGASATLSTGALPLNDWYAVKIANRVPSTGTYTAQIRLASSTDDEFPSVTQEAFPLASGIAQSGYLGAYDVDRFQIYVPTTTGSLQVVASATPTAVVEVFSPAGVTLGSAYGSMTIPSSTIAIHGIGHYTVDVREATGSARAYTVTATLSCANWTSASCDDLSSVTVPIRSNSWGDRIAGRIPVSSDTATYSMSLANTESVTVSLSDYPSSCRFTMDLEPPTDLTFFQSGPVSFWTDDIDSGLGSASSNTAGSRRGPAGHFFAPVAGTYKLVVHQTAGSNCYYRLNVSRSGHTTAPRPAW